MTTSQRRLAFAVVGMAALFLGWVLLETLLNPLKMVRVEVLLADGTTPPTAEVSFQCLRRSCWPIDGGRSFSTRHRAAATKHRAPHGVATLRSPRGCAGLTIVATVPNGGTAATTTFADTATISVPYQPVHAQTMRKEISYGPAQLRLTKGERGCTVSAASGARVARQLSPQDLASPITFRSLDWVDAIDLDETVSGVWVDYGDWVDEVRVDAWDCKSGTATVGVYARHRKGVVSIFEDDDLNRALAMAAADTNITRACIVPGG